MTVESSWEERNGQFLSAALRWLRTLLGRYVEATEPGSVDEELDRAIADMAQLAAGMEPPPALAILASRLGLSRFEEEILLLCAAMELDTRIAPLCARAQGDASRPYPTFALALTVFADAAWDALSPERPLRYWRLVEISQAPGQPLTGSALRADERIVNYLKGLNILDDRLSPLLAALDQADLDQSLPTSTEATVARVVQLLRIAGAPDGASVVQLVGADADSKTLVAQHVAARLDFDCYRLPTGLLPDQVGDLETLSRLWHRETLLRPLSLYLDGDDLEGPSQQEAQRVDRFLTRTGGRTLLAVRETWPVAGRLGTVVDVRRPTPAEQQNAWAEALGDDDGEAPALLAGQFDLSLKVIDDIVRSTPVDHEDLWDACLARARPRMESLAERLEPKATWADIVLPAAELKLLTQLASQVRHRSIVYDGWGFRRRMTRGLGITALFAGQSGTGKTMAAEVIANDLRLALYRIDLSAVMDKYIGETEKNLRKVFDAAETGGAVLFFDEADALFGKRSEVKDSLDRFGNVEINYLLQRMEAYRGLAILATNLKSALDPAFMRRLRFIVDFPFPGAAERRLMWATVFPADTPRASLDLDRLARLNLTGGSIHNIALNAAFLAAASGSAVTMPIVLDAARTEFRKLEKPINEADFHIDAADGAAA
jgi:hypothetical protein